MEPARALPVCRRIQKAHIGEVHPWLFKALPAYGSWNSMRIIEILGEKSIYFIILTALNTLSRLFDIFLKIFVAVFWLIFILP
jgi:hypothetical protein